MKNLVKKAVTKETIISVVISLILTAIIMIFAPDMNIVDKFMIKQAIKQTIKF